MKNLPPLGRSLKVIVTFFDSFRVQLAPGNDIVWPAPYRNRAANRFEACRYEKAGYETLQYVPRSMEPSLQISLFGPIQVHVDGKELPHLRSRKALSLLALLILRDGRPAARGWLAATLWPDVDITKSLSSLRPLISELRKALGPECVRLNAVDRSSISFNVDGLRIDVLEFDKSIKGNNLELAIESYLGPLCEGSTEEWVFQERQVRLEAFVAVVVRHGTAAIQQGACERVIPLYRRAISADPFRDSPRRGLMEAYAAMGDINSALQEYRGYALLLSRELGMAPESQTTELYHQLRRETQKPKQSRHPEKVHHASNISNNLPSRIDAMIGREDEQIDVAALVRDHRLVTLTGVGGIGKTELALAVASNLERAFPAGVWFFAFEALTEEADLYCELAVALKVDFDPKKSAREAVEQHLRDSHALLVFDNCEHIIENAAKVAEQLLRSCWNLRILSTSRKALGTPGEIAWTVPPLGYPQPSSLPNSRATRLRVALDYDGVRLFVKRAKAVRIDFDLDDDSVLSVIDICCHLEGNALGIELAASRIRSMSPQDLAKSLQEHSLNILRTGGSRSCGRHNSVRATLDWSFDLLSNKEQLLFCRLSTFMGGWTLSAAEFVTAGQGLEVWMVGELLDSLVDQSLVIFDATKSRFRMLETVRQYADEKLTQPGERERLLRNLCQWSEEFLRTHEMLVAGSAYSRSVIPIRLEMPNIRQALESCSDNPIVGLSIVSKLRRYFSYDGQIKAGLTLFEATLEQDASQSLTPERADTLLGAGILAQQMGDSEKSRLWLVQALQIFESLELFSGQAEALDELTVLEGAQGNHDRAQDYCERAIEIAKKTGNKVQLAKALQSFCVIAAHDNNPDLLREASEETVRLQRELGGTIALAWSLRSLALYERWVGNWDAAKEHIDEGLRVLAGTDDLNNMAVMHEFAGRFEFEMCNLRSSEYHLQHSIQTYDQANLSHWAFLAKWELIEVRVEQGRLDEAEILAASLSNAASSDLRMMTIAEEVQGVLAQKQEDFVDSRVHFSKGLKIAIDSHYVRAIPQILERLSALSHLEGEDLRAVHYLGAAEEIRSQIRLVRTPFRCKIIDPVIDNCRRSLGPERFCSELKVSGEMDLNSLVNLGI